LWFLRVQRYILFSVLTRLSKYIFTYKGFKIIPLRGLILILLTLSIFPDNKSILLLFGSITVFDLLPAFSTTIISSERV